MPVLQKSLQALFVETVLIISLFTLVGHLSVNFWERYVVQNELSQMKTSLHTLQDTITNISTAYQQLHKELHTLADEAVKGNYKDEILPDKQRTTHYSTLAENLLEDIQIRSMIDNGKNPRKIKTEITQTIANENTQTDVNKTTSYNLPHILKACCKDENVGDKGFHNKKIQYVTRLETRSKQNIRNEAGTSLRDSIKSIAATTKLNDFHNKFNKYYVRENLYNCKNNNSCTAVDNDYASYLRY